MKNYICPICGYPELEKHPDSDPYHEFCPSCCFQFRVTDDDRGYSYEQWRQKWVNEGMKWCSVGMKPPTHWNPAKQLENLKNLAQNDA